MHFNQKRSYINLHQSPQLRRGLQHKKIVLLEVRHPKKLYFYVLLQKMYFYVLLYVLCILGSLAGFFYFMLLLCFPVKAPPTTGRHAHMKVTVINMLKIPKIWVSFGTFIVATACNGFLSINLEPQVTIAPEQPVLQTQNKAEYREVMRSNLGCFLSQSVTVLVVNSSLFGNINFLFICQIFS